MKISTRDKKILLMFLGVAFLVVSYFFVYKGQMNEAADLEAQNELLQARLTELRTMAEDRDFYEAEIDRMNKEVQNYVKSFPAAVKEEDGILLTNRMEKSIDMKISSISLGARELLSTIDGGAEAEDTLRDETLMEKGNRPTQEQIDEIEGTDRTEEEKKRTDVADDMQDGLTQAIHDATWRPALYRNQDTIQFVTDYNGLKDAVKYLNSQVGRMTVNSISTSFDSSTGKLSGSMVINLYSMSNTGATYKEPDAGKVKLGTKNIFGTIEKTEKKRKSSRKK